jgi:hypothetical protein
LFIGASCAGVVLSETAPNCGAIVSVQLGTHLVRAVVAFFIPLGVPAMSLGSRLHAASIAGAHLCSLLWALDVAGDWAQITAEYVALGSTLCSLTWLLWLRQPYSAWRRALADDAFNLGAPTPSKAKQLLDALPDDEFSNDSELSSDGDSDENSSSVASGSTFALSNPLLTVPPRQAPPGSAWKRIIGSSDDSSSSGDDEAPVASTPRRQGRKRPARQLLSDSD